MEIRYKGIQYEIPTRTAERAAKKLEALQKYCPVDPSLVSAYVELGKETEAHHTGKIWKAMVNMNVDGTVYRAEALEESIENAIDRVSNELSKELRKARSKNTTLARRGGGFLKSLTRRFSE